jgi:hypothetical protein
MRRILSGIAIGTLLSLLRAPLGVTFLQWPAVDARTAYGYRALALAITAFALWGARVRSLSTLWLVAITAGYALHGLVLANLWSPGGHVSLWVSALVALAAVILARPAQNDPAGADARVGADVPPASALGSTAALRGSVESTPFVAMLGIAVAAGGVAISLECIARHVRLFGAGLAQDDSVFGTVLLIGIVVGCAAFGWVARATQTRSLAVPIALAGAAGGGYAALRVITSAATNRGLDLYLRSYGLDTSLHGTLVYDALISASCFVVPALFLGAALAGVRTREELFSLLIGATIGVFVVPSLFDVNAATADTDKVLFSAQLIPLALLITVSGAVLAILAVSSRGTLARWIGAAIALAPCTLLFVVTVRPQFVVSPWQNRLIMPFLARDTPEGFLTLEPSRGGVNVATLDRRNLTPGTEDVEADARRLMLAIETLPPARRMKGAIRVLLIGQLTPPRAIVLGDSSAARIDRSAAWWPSMSAIEQQMFGTAALPEGEILDPREARRRIDRGDYDLVVVPSIAGDAPVPTSLHAPESTVVVAWIECDEPLPRQSIGERVIFSAEGLDDPCVGVTLHAFTEGSSLRALAAGESRAAPIPLRRLLLRKFDRQGAGRAAAVERLSDAARGGPDGDLTAGLAIFYRAQVHSSPYESTDEQVELPTEALDHFERSALARTPDVFERRLWEELGRVLVGKRWIEEIYRYVAPIAERHAPWPMLEHVLARADIESLEPDSAIARLTKLTELEPGRFEHWYFLAEARLQGKRERDAVDGYKRALALQPDNSAIKRKLAVLLLQLGDAEGVRIADELLTEDPDDAELLKLLGRELPDDAHSDSAPHDH